MTHQKSMIRRAILFALGRLLSVVSGLMPLSQFATAATTSESFKVFVAPAGSDQWSGLTEQVREAENSGPLQSIAAAQRLVRTELAKMKKGLAVRRPVEVVLLPGDYFLEQELRFNAADSGERDAPVIYSARNTGSVRVSGGRRLRPAGRKDSALIYSDLPTGWKQADPGQLYVAGNRAILARQPNIDQEWYVAQSTWLLGESQENNGKGGFIPSPEARRWLAAIPVAERRNAIVSLYQSWTNGLHHLRPEATGLALQLVPPAYWPALKFGNNQRFHIENLWAAFDEPGEWIGQGDQIYYLPMSQETTSEANVDVILAVRERLIYFEESSAAGVSHDILFRNISFEHTRLSVPEAGVLDIQAAVAVGAAVEVNNAARIGIESCSVRHIGGYGIWFRNNVRESRIRGSRFDDLGAGGIKLGSVTRQSDGLPTGQNEIAENVIRNTGKIMVGAVGIWIGPSWDNTVSNNLIAQTSYSGISVGWKWGYGEATAGRNIITANLLYNIGQGTIADLGGIYTLGPSPGTVISRNVIREVRGVRNYGAGAWGIYNDEGSSQFLIEDNVVIGTDSGAYHLHYGRNNLVRSNLFAGGRDAELRITKGDPNEVSVTFERNVVQTSASHVLAGAFDDHNTVFRGNLLNAEAVQSVDGQRCGGGCRTASLEVLSDGLPHQLIVRGLDVKDALRWAAIAQQAGPAGLLVEQLGQVNLVLPVIGNAGPRAFYLYLDAMPLDSRPAGLTYYASKDKPGVLAVAASPDDASRKCLKFIDGEPGPRYEPFTYVRLEHYDGSAEVKFDVWLDERVEFIHEWRDVANPYHVGPSIQFTPLGIFVNGRIVAAVRPRTWLHVVVRAALGKQAGRWDLDITGGAETHLRQIPLSGPPGGWQKLEWLGFISNTAGYSEACLAGLSVEPH